MDRRQVGDKQRLVAGLALVKQLEQIASEAALEQPLGGLGEWPEGVERCVFHDPSDQSL